MIATAQTVTAEATEISGDTKHFIDRDAELKIIREKIEAIKNGKRLFDFILIISGILGIGKTTLLDKIEQEAKSQNIDIEKVSCNDIEKFISNLQSKLEKAPLVLMIDDSHNIDEETQEKLENILTRVHPQNRLFVVLAGRTDLRWKNFELRRRTQVRALNRLNEADAELLLTKLGRPELGKPIYQVASGYPLATMKAYRWASDNLKPAETIKERETDLIFELVRNILSEYILNHIPEQERDELVFLLKKVSVLRRFDDNILCDLLKELDKSRYSSINMIDARGFIRKMATSTHLIKWDSSKMAYALDISMRRLLCLEIKFHDIESMQAIHEFMTKWYDYVIDKAIEPYKNDPQKSYPPQTVLYLIEYLFHFVQLCQLTDKTAQHIETDIEQKITPLFERYNPTEKNHFYEEFKKDNDLAELLGDNYNQLTEFVKKQL